MVLADVTVRLLFDLQQRLPRNVGVVVDRHAVGPHVKAYIVAVEALAEKARADMLARMLLHMVEAARPVDFALDARAGGQGTVAKMRDDAVLFVHRKHLRAAERAGIVRLAAALGVKGRFIEPDGAAALCLLAGEDGGRKGPHEWVFIIKLSCFHAACLLSRSGRAPVFHAARGKRARRSPARRSRRFARRR